MSGNIFYAPGSDAPIRGASDTNPNRNDGSNTLGFTTGAGRKYFEENPSQGYQLLVNSLGGQDSGLGRYASRHFNEVYGQYTKEAMGNPNLVFTDWLNKYAQSGQLQQQFQGASPFARDPYNTPQWSSSRFLG